MSNTAILPQIQPITNKQIRDLTGQRFGRLLVLGFVGSIDVGDRPQRKTQWLCQCACGNHTIVTGGNLTTGTSNSCGCYKNERSSENGKRNKTHGMKGTPEYSAWRSMLDRCYCPKMDSFDRYGGRGIKVCERWHKFENFFADMGYRPTHGHSLDRIDNSGNYELGNCRWATLVEQQNNRDCNRRFTHNGETHTVAEWSRIVNINYYTLYTRLCESGWTVKNALTMQP